MHVMSQEKDVRIIVGSFDGQWAGRIFCQAYKLGIYGRRYQWILGSFDDKWWQKDFFSSSDSFNNDNNNIGATTDSNCTEDQILEAIDGLISIDVLPLSSSREITVSGMTAYEYEAAYNRLRKKEYSKYHGYAYDGVWTIAYAIHLVSVKLRAQNSDLTFKDFEYKNPFWAELLKQALNETSFVGVTVSVTHLHFMPLSYPTECQSVLSCLTGFDEKVNCLCHCILYFQGNVSFEGNERKGSILLKQFQGGREVQIGEYHSTTDTLDFNVGEDIYWRGNLKLSHT